jgi:hypothetical protein
VPRRGYRFTLDVKGEDRPERESAAGASAVPKEAAAPPEPEPVTLQPTPAAGPPEAVNKPLRQWRLYAAVVIAALVAAASVLAIIGLARAPSEPVVRPVSEPVVRAVEPRRLSIVAMPFVNASGEPKDAELAAALTEDVALSLAQIEGSFVVAHSSGRGEIAIRAPGRQDNRPSPLAACGERAKFARFGEQTRWRCDRWGRPWTRGRHQYQFGVHTTSSSTA